MSKSHAIGAVRRKRAELAGELIVTGGDSAIDFDMGEDTLDAIALTV